MFKQFGRQLPTLTLTLIDENPNSQVFTSESNRLRFIEELVTEAASAIKVQT